LTQFSQKHKEGGIKSQDNPKGQTFRDFYSFTNGAILDITMTQNQSINGVLEYWSIVKTRKAENADSEFYHYSNTPSLHYSI
jgi:hypothetical protein